MSRPKYAPITSSLLVRKGEAQPWHQPGSDLAEFAVHLRRFDAPPVAEFKRETFADHREHELHDHAAQNAAPDEHTRRYTLRLSPSEYERFGIIAVKKEISRQQVLRQAVEQYLAAVQQEYRSQCGCLGACRGAC